MQVWIDESTHHDSRIKYRRFEHAKPQSPVAGCIKMYVKENVMEHVCHIIDVFI